MYTPFDSQKKIIETMIMDFMKSQEFKAEMSKQVRMEIEASKAKYSRENNSNTLSYEMLTRGNVNMQAKLAANGYDVYGKTLIPSNDAVGSSKNVYNKMKNKINYGSSPSKGYTNTGQRSFAKGDS